MTLEEFNKKLEDVNRQIGYSILKPLRDDEYQMLKVIHSFEPPFVDSKLFFDFLDNIQDGGIFDDIDEELKNKLLSYGKYKDMIGEKNIEIKSVDILPMEIKKVDYKEFEEERELCRNGVKISLIDFMDRLKEEVDDIEVLSRLIQGNFKSKDERDLYNKTVSYLLENGYRRLPVYDKNSGRVFYIRERDIEESGFNYDDISVSDVKFIKSSSERYIEIEGKKLPCDGFDGEDIESYSNEMIPVESIDISSQSEIPGDIRDRVNEILSNKSEKRGDIENMLVLYNHIVNEYERVYKEYQKTYENLINEFDDRVNRSLQRNNMWNDSISYVASNPLHVIFPLFLYIQTFEALYKVGYEAIRLKINQNRQLKNSYRDISERREEMYKVHNEIMRQYTFIDRELNEARMLLSLDPDVINNDIKLLEKYNSNMIINHLKNGEIKELVEINKKLTGTFTIGRSHHQSFKSITQIDNHLQNIHSETGFINRSKFARLFNIYLSDKKRVPRFTHTLNSVKLNDLLRFMDKDDFVKGRESLTTIRNDFTIEHRDDFKRFQRLRDMVDEKDRTKVNKIINYLEMGYINRDDYNNLYILLNEIKSEYSDHPTIKSEVNIVLKSIGNRKFRNRFDEIERDFNLLKGYVEKYSIENVADIDVKSLGFGEDFLTRLSTFIDMESLFREKDIAMRGQYEIDSILNIYNEYKNSMYKNSDFLKSIILNADDYKKHINSVKSIDFEESNKQINIEENMIKGRNP